MNLLTFFDKESDAPKIRIIAMALIAGLTNGLLLAFINVAAQNVSDQETNTRFFLFYLVAFILYIYAERYAFAQATIGIEDAIRKIRVRITDKIRHTELLFIENAGRGEMYTQLTQDSNLISQTALVLVSAASSAITLVFSLLYIAWLSPPAFLIVVITLIFSVYLYLSIDEQVTKGIDKATGKEAEFFDSLNHVLDGFKEIRINRRKNNDLFEHVKVISDETEEIKVKVGIQLVTAMMFSQTTFYVLLGFLVFVMPSFSPSHAEIIFKITAATLFIIGPISMIVSAIPMISRTNVALEHLYKLETKLDTAISDYDKKEEKEPEEPFTIEPLEFKKIQLEEAIFHYTDKQGKKLFSIGPVSLTIKKGELLFIIGGNGSGKSTLLKLLVGLYYPYAGTLYLDNEELDQSNYQNYRELFSIIFTDFHLFDKLYGLASVDEQAIKTWLQTMELNKKTQYTDGKFTNINLSTGQKKRLAFIAAMLEDKPIYVFDELAADQDPHFRKYFYEVILQNLKKQGKTIIAVTHDDKYFHTADRILKMEYGQLTSYDESFK